MIVVETRTMNTAMVGALRARRFDLTRGPRVIASAGTLEITGVNILTKAECPAGGESFVFVGTWKYIRAPVVAYVVAVGLIDTYICTRARFGTAARGVLTKFAIVVFDASTFAGSVRAAILAWISWTRLHQVSSHTTKRTSIGTLAVTLECRGAEFLADSAIFARVRRTRRLDFTVFARVVVDAFAGGWFSFDTRAGVLTWVFLGARFRGWWRGGLAVRSCEPGFAGAVVGVVRVVNAGAAVFTEAGCGFAFWRDVAVVAGVAVCTGAAVL